MEKQGALVTELQRAQNYAYSVLAVSQRVRQSLIEVLSI